jgi:superfamily II RNA helicase
MLPIVIFCFSKAKIIELSQKMLSFDLNTKNETGKITAFFNNALKKLKPTDRELP